MRLLLLTDGRETRRRIAATLALLPGLQIVEPSADGDPFEQVTTEAADVVLLGAVCRGWARPVDFVARLRRSGNTVPVVLIARRSGVEETLAVMAQGAQSYVFDCDLHPDVLLPVVRAALERASLREVGRLGAAVPTRRGVGALVGSSPAIERVRKLVARVAGSDATVLLRGPTGSGKEVVARAIHEMSPRAGEPFVALNCSALPGTLVESLLFGHERGAFTGASARVRGQLEVVGRGTLLLDEIAEMPVELQAKLLRVIEDRQFRPLGAETERPLRARLLAASHANLETRVQEGRFREDLFYRLNVLSIRVPSLAERVEDVRPLAAAFAAEGGGRLRLTEDAMAHLGKLPWPGNVRELRNLIERVRTVVDTDVVDAAALRDVLEESGPSDATRAVETIARAIVSLPAGDEPTLCVIERAVVAHAMRVCEGNKSAAARMLGFERRRLDRRLPRA